MNGPDIAHAVTIARQLIAEACRRVAARQLLTDEKLAELMDQLADEIARNDE
jgi:hypothetical protein